MVEAAGVRETATGLQVEDFEVVHAETRVVEQMRRNRFSWVDGEVAELLLLGRGKTCESVFYLCGSRRRVCVGHSNREQSIIDQNAGSGGDTFERKRAAALDSGVSQFVVAVVPLSYSTTSA